jgi:hypothetical protein
MADFDWDDASLDQERLCKLADLDRWYASVFRLEAWRQGRGISQTSAVQDS